MSGSDIESRRPSYAELEALVAELRALSLVQQAKIVELEARVDGNSRNSSRPPSSDGYAKPRADAKKDKQKRSLRERSGRKPGGQAGSGGHHLARREAIDERVEHRPACCEGCRAGLEGAQRLDGGESRQVLDLPEGPLLRVVEHVAARWRCECGHVTAGVFPAGVAAPVQYGSRIRAAGVYLCVFQLIPYDRASELLADLAGAPVSAGSLAAWVAAAADGLCDFDEHLRELLADAEVAHFDETGARIAGRLGWVHSASTKKLTRYTAHAKRGCKAIDAAGVLPGFGGTAVHDGWKPYRKYPDAAHALCNAHHLRELVAASQAGHAWPAEISALLREANSLAHAARTAGQDHLTADVLAAITARYEAIVASGHREHPPVQAKNTKAHNLLLRLARDQADTLRFASDLQVPFTNNLAEQDIRMVKLQQKISGCFRTTQGAERFTTIRSYTSTARKHGISALEALATLTAGTPWQPPPAPA